MHSNGLLVVGATMIYGQKGRDAEVRRNFGVLGLSFPMFRRTQAVGKLRSLKFFGQQDKVEEMVDTCAGQPPNFVKVLRPLLPTRQAGTKLFYLYK